MYILKIISYLSINIYNVNNNINNNIKSKNENFYTIKIKFILT